MSEVDKMSDAELRSKLMEYGFPMVPITGTTRAVMRKKLKILMDTKNKSNKERRSLGRYSSEEDSDNEVKARKNDAKRRVTMGGPGFMSPPSTSKVTTRKTTFVNDSNSMRNEPLPPPQQPAPAPVPVVAPLHKEVKAVTTTTTRTTRILEKANDEYDTGSDSDEVADSFSSVNSSSYNRGEASYNRGEASYNRGEASYNRGEASHNHGEGLIGSRPKISSPKPMETSTYENRFSSPPARGLSSADVAGDRLQQIRSRLSLSTNYDRPLYTSSPADEVISNRENTPFLSNFTRRLSQLRENSNLGEYKSQIKESDANGGGFSARSYLNNYRSQTGSGGRSTSDYKQTNWGKIKEKYISVMVLVAAFLFFIFLAVVYLGIRSDTALESAAIVPLCANNNVNLQCILKEDKENTLDLLKVLLPKLRKQAVENRCRSNRIKPFLTETEIVDYIAKEFSVTDEDQIKKDLRNLEILTFFNDIWGIKLLLLNNKKDDMIDSEVVKKMDSVLYPENKYKLKALIIPEPYIPWGCYLYEKFSALFVFLITIGVGFSILYSINYGFKYWQYYQQKQEEEDMQLVESIIDLLQSNASTNTESNYLVINHVRDMLIPLNERKRKEKTWIRAMRNINEKESRIRTEIQMVKGEPTEVWRWLGDPNISGAGSRNKSWQGQAFETQVGSVNSLPCSPTPCLKIRGMVEDGDRNIHLIKRAVLSKCADECRILHCAVDTKLNCVYLKCASTGDAAVAYRNLHGWWYAGNLVTVKYIRLERYMQRFPDSPTNGPYLKCSNDRNNC